LIYNSSSGIVENNSKGFSAGYDSSLGLLLNGEAIRISIFNTNGAIIKSGSLNDLKGISLKSGIYFVKSENKTVKILVP
jgi:hypothetical protein